MTPAQTTTSLHLTKLIRARRERVFEAWTNPELIKQWMGPGDITVPAAQVELKVGGRYRMEMDNAGKQLAVYGEYVEIVPNRKLVFTWGWEGPNRCETLVTVRFEDKDGGTEVTLLHERFANADDMGRHEHGWTGSLAKLATVVER
jgi:uncharacterized protein YndB with AHSA1/START domain